MCQSRGKHKRNTESGLKNVSKQKYIRINKDYLEGKKEQAPIPIRNSNMYTVELDGVVQQDRDAKDIFIFKKYTLQD